MGEVIEVSGIRFEESKIANLQDNRVFASINRSDIISMVFQWGILSQRPVVQVILGVFISLLGVLSLRFIYFWLIYGGVAFDYQIMLSLLLPLGVWVIVDALKTGHYLSIQLHEGTDKMTFQKPQDQDSLEQLSRQLKSKLNYEVSFAEVNTPPLCKECSLSFIMLQFIQKVSKEGTMTRHERISPEGANKKVKTSEALLVCAYEEDEKFRQMQLEGAVSYKEFKKKVSSIPKDQEIIFYCSSAQEEESAARAVEAEDQGFQNVRILGEGLKAWRKAGYRVEGNG